VLEFARSLADAAPGTLDRFVAPLLEEEDAEEGGLAARYAGEFGEFDAARRRLRDAVRSAESRRGITAALETDLGLAEGAFRSLADVQLPHDSAELDSFANRLRASKRRFEPARGNGVHGPARYCLGVLELIAGDYEAADRHFGRARGLSNGTP